MAKRCGDFRVDFFTVADQYKIASEALWDDRMMKLVVRAGGFGRVVSCRRRCIYIEKSEPAAGKNESKTSLFCASVDTTASSVES
jgi:hypothetical protein